MAAAEVGADERSAIPIQTLSADHCDLTPRTTEIAQSHGSIVARQAKAGRPVRLRHGLDHAGGPANDRDIAWLQTRAAERVGGR